MTEAYNQSVNAINENLQILKRSGASYEHLLQRLNASIEKLEQVYFYHNQQKTELVKEKQKQDLFLENLKKYSVEQNLKLKTSSDSVESFSNMSKLTLSNCNFKKLNEVKMADSIEKLFRFLFVNLYNEFEKDFDFNNFETTQTSIFIKGVDIQKANNYLPNEKGTFSCLDSNVLF